MSNLRIKEGVRLVGLSNQILLAATVALALWNEEFPDVELCITCGSDGKHGRASKHFVGNAIDIRTFSLPGGYVGDGAKRATAKLKDLLGSEFDVVLEGDHIHVEWDPKINPEAK